MSFFFMLELCLAKLHQHVVMKQSDATNNDDEDAFWSVAFLPNNSTHHIEADDDEECTSVERSFAILPPSTTNAATEPLTLRIRTNANDGVLGDVSGIPWDASLLLAGYLYGTEDGRRLCFDALDCCVDKTGKESHSSGDGGILELGSGLGMVGLAAYAAARESSRSACIEQTNTRLVITDRNDEGILSLLKTNVDTNLSQMCGDDCNNPQTFGEKPCISVEAWDWIEVSRHFHTLDKEHTDNIDSCERAFPRGPFNLILGSALIYLPDHAAPCADTIYYYLSDNTTNDLCPSHVSAKRMKRQAIIVQLPDRSGVATHFLPRCCELGLQVTCSPLDEELIKRVEAGLNERIASAKEYRIYFVTKKI